MWSGARLTILPALFTWAASLLAPAAGATDPAREHHHSPAWVHHVEAYQGDPVGSSIQAQAAHECPHCPQHSCPTYGPCSAGGSAAPALAATILDAPRSILAPRAWVSDRPLSANPTPPIPPPQPLL